MISRTYSMDDRKDYRRYYLINMEIGLIVALGLLLILFKIHFYPEQEIELPDQVQEVVKMEEIVQTKQQEHVPAPPKPMVPVAVPNSEVIADEILDFDAELDMGSQIDLPAAPPAQAKKEETNPENEVFVVVEHMPELIGGLPNLQRKIKYPEMARMAGIEGRVIVQFTITERGTVINPVVVRGIGGGCDEEAVRAIKEARFKPGMQRGRPVKVRYTIPINFNMKDNASS